MEIEKIKGVFFDCWDTILEFHMSDEKWNIRSLMEHAVNKTEIDWEKVHLFTESFFRDYYSSRLNHELRIQEILNLVVLQYDIHLDCDLDVCAHDILNHLSPEPVQGLDGFLSYLEMKNVPYFCLSNTVYPQDDTRKLIEKYFLGHHFSFVLASYEVGVKKPNPLFFHVGAKKAGLDVKDCIYIGDKIYQDCYGSYKSGFGSSIYLNWKQDKEKQISSLSSLCLESFPYVEVDSYAMLMEVLGK